MMFFKRLIRKVTAAVQRTRRRPAKFYHDPKPPRLDSMRDITPPPLFTNELRPLPRISLASERGSKISNFAKSEDISHLELNDDDRLETNFDLEPGEWPERKQAMRRETSSVTQEDSPDTPAMRLIVVRSEREKQRALLLTPSTYMKTQTFLRMRQGIRDVDAEIAANTTEVENLIAAKNALEEQEEPSIPGAFYDDDGEAENERQHLLMLTFVRKLRLCEQTLGGLEEQRLSVVAELETLQDRFLDDLEAALRDKHPLVAPRSSFDGRRTAVKWWMT